MGAPVFVPCFLVVTQIKQALFTIADCINSIHLNSSRDKIRPGSLRLSLMAMLNFSEPRSSQCPFTDKMYPVYGELMY
jgi:hypothetical protein